MIGRGLIVIACGLLPTGSGRAQTTARPLIIDVHLHALRLASFAFAGSPPLTMCLGGFWPGMAERFPALDTCREPLLSPATDDEVLRSTLSILEKHNVIGVASGPRAVVRQWKDAAPTRIIPALFSSGSTSLDSVRKWITDSSVRVLGEMTFQYAGLAATDSLPEAWFALAEQFDIPIGVHVGLGAAGAPYVQGPPYRMRLSSPLLLEETLVRHPKLRLYVMHAGWPMLDEMVGLLYAHPQVYVDISAINWFIPRVEFHSYLRRLVAAGFARRIMFGSDQMIWPGSVERAIESIETAPFLTAQDKRDIFCNNAARFLRLLESESSGRDICK